jgi:hypothetical protein
VGTHLIRKGAVLYLALLPGGPPAASTCIQTGWTMGRLKDIYLRYVTSGDHFVGRCLSLLLVLRTDFAVSPCHFTSDNLPWIENSRLLQFPMVGLVVGFEKMTCMCLVIVPLFVVKGYLERKPCIFTDKLFASKCRVAINVRVCTCIVSME